MRINAYGALLFFAVLNTSLSVARGQSVKAHEQSAPITSENPPLMTKSNSVAEGMIMGGREFATERLNVRGSHPISSLRTNESFAQFDFSIGQLDSDEYKDVDGKNMSIESKTNLAHVGLGATAVLTNGIRLGAHIDTADDIARVRSRNSDASLKTKLAVNDASFFGAIGVTQNFGIGLNMLMVDRKISSKQESATIAWPAVMGMLENAEVTFDYLQGNSSTNIDGHWRLTSIIGLGNSNFLTALLSRAKSDNGTAYWDTNLGWRAKTSNRGSMGVDLMYTQQLDDQDGNCIAPAGRGIKADIDFKISDKVVVSAGGSVQGGRCVANGLTTVLLARQYKGALTLVF